MDELIELLERTLREAKTALAEAKRVNGSNQRIRIESSMYDFSTDLLSTIIGYKENTLTRCPALVRVTLEVAPDTISQGFTNFSVRCDPIQTYVEGSYRILAVEAVK